jgi:hypothetical protein
MTAPRGEMSVHSIASPFDVMSGWRSQRYGRAFAAPPPDWVDNDPASAEQPWVGDHPADRLIHFMGYRGRELTHRGDAVSVGQLGLQASDTGFAFCEIAVQKSVLERDIIWSAISYGWIVERVGDAK